MKCRQTRRLLILSVSSHNIELLSAISCGSWCVGFPPASSMLRAWNVDVTPDRVLQKRRVSGYRTEHELLLWESAWSVVDELSWLFSHIALRLISQFFPMFGICDVLLFSALLSILSSSDSVVAGWTCHSLCCVTGRRHPGMPCTFCLEPFWGQSVGKAAYLPVFLLLVLFLPLCLKQ